MKSESWQLAMCALAVVLSVFLRFYKLDTVPPGLHRDEATDGNDAVAAWRTGDFRVFYPENNGREGLVINLQAVAFGLTGRARPWVLRLPVALLGTLTIIGLYLLARQLGLRRTAWLAAWLMAASFWHINVSRFGTRVVAAPCFLVWSLWLWGTAVNQGRGRLTRAVLAGFVYGLGFYTYTAYLLTPLIMMIACSRRETRAPWSVAAIAVGAAVVTALPLAIFVLWHPDVYFHRVYQLSSLATKHPVHDLARNAWQTAGMFNFAGDTNPRHNIPGRAMLFWPVGILFLIGVIIAARRQRLLLWWLVIGLVPAVVVNEGVPHSHRAVLAAPATFLLAALGAKWMIETVERCRWPKLAPALTTLLVAAVAVEGYRSYFVVWACDARVALAFDDSWVESVARLEALPQAEPKYLILDPDPATVRGLPLPAQTIMFLTDTATAERQQAKNLFYLRLDQTNQLAGRPGYVIRMHETRPGTRQR